jgi:hypothetical protein
MPEQEISLPEGVSEAEWETERRRFQNPRIRGFAGCLRKIDEVLESDYAFLHCSPERLQHIWNTVLEVAATLRNDIRPLLQTPSSIPRLEEARASAAFSLDLLAGDLLAKIDRYPHQLTEDRLLEVRRFLCSTIGQLHAFLRDTLSELLNSDLREMGTDYLMSKRLPRDLEEAEWLYTSVERLKEYLTGLESDQRRHLSELINWLQHAAKLPEGESWKQAKGLLEEILEVLVPRLKEARSLHGIRYDDGQVLDGFLMELPVECRTLIELQALGSDLAGRMESTLSDARREAPLMQEFHAVISSRIERQLGKLDRSLQDLTAFVALWIDGISKRRALQFRETN